MTKEEAIYRLNNTAWLGSHADRVATEEAVQMAIEALKEQPPLLKISKTVNREEFENIIKNSPMMLITPDTEKIELIREQQWIPVSERLPDKDFTDVLVQIGHGEYALYETAYRVRGRWVFYSDRQDGEGQSVIAWMECPEPYKGEE